MGGSRRLWLPEPNLHTSKLTTTNHLAIFSPGVKAQWKLHITSPDAWQSSACFETTMTTILWHCMHCHLLPTIDGLQLTSAIRGGRPWEPLVDRSAPGRCAHVPALNNNWGPGLVVLRLGAGLNTAKVRRKIRRKVRRNNTPVGTSKVSEHQDLETSPQGLYSHAHRPRATPNTHPREEIR